MSIDTEKPVHMIVLDAGPIIKNEPSVSSLLAQAAILVTTPAVISEIRDAATRSRVETTLTPFLTMREPRPASIKFITDFARKTGDLPVLSRPDVQILALAYELELERNGGDWRLRNNPGQKRTNGPPPAKQTEEEGLESKEAEESLEASTSAVVPEEAEHSVDHTEGVSLNATENASKAVPQNVDDVSSSSSTQQTPLQDTPASVSQEIISDNLANLHVLTATEPDEYELSTLQSEDHNQNDSQQDASGDFDSEGWITPSNIKKQQAKDENTSIAQVPEPKTMQVAVS